MDTELSGQFLTNSVTSIANATIKIAIAIFNNTLFKNFSVLNNRNRQSVPRSFR